jgi:peptide deformylase
MAIRNIREEGDEVLRKKSKEIDVINDRIIELANDMVETMHEAEGCGLAAPQVGILKRLIVVDVGDGPIELVNPRIVSQEGEKTEAEGCLSIPGVVGEVKRPYKVVVEALNLKGEEIVIEGEGILARALCHEIDHLDGILFIDKATKIVDNNQPDYD